MGRLLFSACMKRVTFVLLLLASCGTDRPVITTVGLHQSCPTSGCATGQECVQAAQPGGSTKSCEIKCTENADCPEGMACSLPPLLPDTTPYICE